MRTQLLRSIVVVALAASATAAVAADHRDSPLTTGDPAADINDVYTFVNPGNPAETIVAVTVLPVAGAASRFSDAVDYRIHLDNGVSEIVITCRSGAQSTTMSCAGPGDLAVSGPVGEIVAGTGLRMFAGLRDDPFYFDLAAFNQTRATLVPAFTNPGTNFFANLNTLAIVLGIDSSRINNSGANPVVRVFASTVRTGEVGITTGGISGSWFDAANPGHGLHVEVLPPVAEGEPDRIAVAWYVYNGQGQQRWIVGDGTIDTDGNSATISNAISTAGGLFPPAFQSSQVTSTPFGTLTLEFSSCSSGTLTFDSTDPQFGDGSIAISRLTQIKGLPCTYFAFGQIDRMGRPGINTVLIDLLASTGKKDAYNRAGDRAGWAAAFQNEMQNNAAALDTLDGTTGNALLPAATLAAVLVDDRLIIDVSKPQCDAYLAVELNAGQCGGRTLARDVIDDSLGALVGPGVSDFVANDSTFLADFPFLAAPN